MDYMVDMAISLKNYISAAFLKLELQNKIIDNISRSLLDGGWSLMDELTKEENYTLARMCGEIWNGVNNQTQSYSDMLDYMQQKIIPVFVVGYGS